MRLLFLMFLLSCTFWVQAQCAFSISGKVLDEHHDEPLEYSTVLIEETGGGAVADSTGFFILSDLCAGEYHLRVSHVGCEHVHLFVDLKKDTAVNIFLEHHSEHLADVIVKVENVPSMTQGSVVVSEEASGQTLSQILTKVVGVSSISNGSGIAKPVIHGLYGNRIVVLNNGLEQAGQRWGNDH
ncbi:MAG: iron complex outermembrane receptor protein, partial [Limisphaerales bacterium]